MGWLSDKFESWATGNDPEEGTYDDPDAGTEHWSDERWDAYDAGFDVDDDGDW